MLGFAEPLGHDCHHVRVLQVTHHVSLRQCPVWHIAKVWQGPPDGIGGTCLDVMSTGAYIAKPSPIQQTGVTSHLGSPGTAVGSQLAQDRRDVVIDGSVGHEQPIGDLGIGHPLGEVTKHLELASGQAEGVVPRGPGRSPGDTVDPCLGQLGAKPGRQRRGPQIIEDAQCLDPGLGRSVGEGHRTVVGNAPLLPEWRQRPPSPRHRPNDTAPARYRGFGRSRR